MILSVGNRINCGWGGCTSVTLSTTKLAWTDIVVTWVILSTLDRRRLCEEW